MPELSDNVMTAVPRPRVEALLARAWNQRVTLVAAGGGHGKTTALRRLAATGPSRWLGIRPVDGTVELLAARIAEALELGPIAGLADPGAGTGAEDRRGLAEAQAAVLCDAVARRDEPLLLVLDDLERLAAGGATAHLLRALALQAPRQLHLVLSGQWLPNLGLGAAADTGDLLEIAAPDLMFTTEETAALLADRLGDHDRALAERCRTLTGGWAAALALVVDRLGRVESGGRQGLLDRLPLLGSPLWREFVTELLEREPADARRALMLAAVAPGVDPELADAIGVASASSTLAQLARRGLLVAGGDNEAALTMSPVLAGAVAELLPRDDVEQLRDRAGAWLEAEGRIGEALECLAPGPATATRALLGRCGHELVARGYGARVAEVIRAVGTQGTPRLEAIFGEAMQAVGQWDGAIEAYRRARRMSPDCRLPPSVAWRFGALLYFRGDSAAALEVLDSARVRGHAAGADDALVAAWLSSAHWSRGETEEAAALASSAVAGAERSGDPRALAAAHVACALVAASAGDREGNERHYRAALVAAADAGDSIQLARIRANLSSRALEEGDYPRAIEEADAALRAGAGHRFFAALALCNKAEGLMRLGELDNARGTLAESIEIYETLGSLQACAPYTLLGTLYWERGDLARARILFERAERLAAQAEDAHSIVFARCGLARAVAADDPVGARGYAARALERASSLERAHALCASAWVELIARDSVSAERLARDAETEARATGDRPALADALMLRGLAERPAGVHHLEAAAGLWGELGNPVARERTLLAIAIFQDDGAVAAVLRDRLVARGVVPELDLARSPSSAVQIVTLGRFAVLRAGTVVPAADWQSRKARDLLKLLVGRRGRPVTREAAAEALWPGEPPGPLSNRLSVALSTLRKVLDPDRGRPTDHYIAADAQTLALRVDHVEVDVVAFLHAADEAIAGGSPEALREAERMYTGDFLEEDLYEDWSVDCREHARSVALEVSRRLADAAARGGDDEDASRHLRRILERDPHDEAAWIDLIAALGRLRRYGEARRQHALYARRMAELSVPPVALAMALAGRP
jgi:ATP/maltotriose-dependent transcriptional regulator MalT/DNA-binding SARP family transcriptional activator